MPYPVAACRGKSGSPFTPASLAPTLWLKDTGYFTTDVGSTPAVADGDPVGRWEDQSGNNNHPTQATTTKRATLKLAIQNGRSVLRFDGVDDFLRAVFTLNQPYTRFAVMVNRGPQNGSKVMLDGGAAVRAYMIWNAANTPGIYGGANLNGGTYTGTSWHVWRGTFNGVNSKISLDGDAPSTGDAGALIAAGISIGAIAAGGYACDMDIGEVLDFSRSLPDAEVVQVVNYLRSRWGI